jgi:hypothetical protein
MRRIIFSVTTGLVTAALSLAISALPSFAQPTLTLTGVLGEPFFREEVGPGIPLYLLTDEATGITYTLLGGFVDVTPFVGQRVTVRTAAVPGIDPFSQFVIQIQLAPPAAPSGGTLPRTGGPSLLLVPSIALILGGGIMGATLRRRRRRNP